MSRASGTAANLDAVLAQQGEVQVMLPSYGQKRFFVLDQLDDEAAYTIPVGVRLKGKLNVDALRQAIQAIVDRHEALRTIFALDGDEPVQVILPSLEIELRHEDLTALPPASREKALLALADRNSNASFDLGSGPLLTVTLVKLAAEEHALLLSIHHIAADGSSIAVLFAELETAYAAFLTGAQPQFPSLPLQYADFADWQRRVVEGGGASRQIDYWKAQLSELTPLELPTDRPRPAAQTQNGSHRELLIDGSVAEGIRTLARREGATPYMAFLAAFFAFLHRTTAQTDLVVGSITSGRLRPEVEPLIGLFLNTLAVRVNVSGEATFLELLRSVRDTATAAYSNQDVPFEFIVEAVQPARDQSRSPIFQVAFQLLETLARDLNLPGLSASHVRGSKQSAKFDLTLMLHAAPQGGIRAVLEYNSDLFDAATVEHMLSHYAILLAGIAHDNTSAIARLPLMHADEYALVTESYNSSAAPIPDWCLPERVLSQAAETPTAVAIRALDAILTYGELATRVQTLADHLRHTAEIRPGDRVAVFMDRTSSMVVALLAVNACGAAYVPVDTAYPTERTAHVLGDAGVRAILTDAQSSASLPPTVAPVMMADTLCTAPRAASSAPALARIDPLSTVYVIYTSGSTGKPKGVAVRHRALTNFISSMAAAPGLSAPDTIVAVTTISFDIAGLELWLPLCVGASITLASRAVSTDGIALRQLVDETTARFSHAGVVMQATPATWLLMLEAGWVGAPNLTMLCGGEAWPPKLAAALLTRGNALWNVYGPTETTIWSARHNVRSASDVSLGVPLANTQLFVLEPNGNAAPLGVPGELWIGGDGLALGYHGRPDLTAERFVVHPTFGRLYRTGDRVVRRANGQLFYQGRLDDQVKLNGYRIELGEIESVLAAQPGVQQAVAVVQRTDGDAVLVAFVVTDVVPDYDISFGASLREAIRRSLPVYMVPRIVQRIDVLPLTPNGKIDRRLLPQITGAAAATEYVAPRTVIEHAVAEVWQDVLGREPVGIHDGFFELGGNSLAAMRVGVRLGERFNVAVPVRVLFEQPTPAALAGWLEARVLSTADADMADILAELESMSDEEAHALLSQSPVEPS